LHLGLDCVFAVGNFLFSMLRYPTTSKMPESLWRTYDGCLEYNLKRINIANYQGRPLEKMLARFLLSRAAALDELSVTLAAGLYPRKKDTTKELTSWRWNRHTRVNCN
jgi:hypothetical protein